MIIMESTTTMIMAMPTTSSDFHAMDTGNATASMPSMPAGMDMSCKISMLWNWDTIDTCFLAKSWHIRSHGAFAGSCIGVICLVLVLEMLRRLGREYDAFILRRARLNRMYMAGSSTVSNQSKLRERSYRRISTDDGLSKATDTESIRKTHPQNDRIIAEPVSSMNLNLDSAGAPVPVEPVAQTEVYLPCAKETYRPSVVEHIVHAFMHMLQFAVAYFIMLFAMYFNGYIIICIFVGAFLGSLIFSWEPVSLGKENDATAVTKCCG